MAPSTRRGTSETLNLHELITHARRKDKGEPYLSVKTTRDRTSLSLDKSSSTYQVPHPKKYFSDPCYRGECSTQYYRDQDSTRMGLILRLSRSGLRTTPASKRLTTSASL